MNKIEELISTLLNVRSESTAFAGVVPVYLNSRYTRSSAARLLGNADECLENVVQALITTMLQDEELDVKIDCINSLIKIGLRHNEYFDKVSEALSKSTQDADAEVRHTALEELWNFDAAGAARIAIYLKLDQDELVAEYAKKILEINI